MVRRGVPTKNLTPGDIERAANDTVRRVITLQQGIPTEAAKDIVKFIKDNKLKKVQAAIQADQVRVSSPSKDELAGSHAPAARTRFRRRASSLATIGAEEELMTAGASRARSDGDCRRVRRHRRAVRAHQRLRQSTRRKPPCLVAATAGQPAGQRGREGAGRLSGPHQPVRHAPPEARELAAEAVEGVDPGADRRAPARAGEVDSGRASRMRKRATSSHPNRRRCSRQLLAKVFGGPDGAALEGFDHGRESGRAKSQGQRPLPGRAFRVSTIPPQVLEATAEAAGRNGIPLRRQRSDSDGHTRAHRRRLHPGTRSRSEHMVDDMLKRLSATCTVLALCSRFSRGVTTRPRRAGADAAAGSRRPRRSRCPTRPTR